MGGGNDSTPNVFNMMYLDALSIYIFEILNFNIINIWFINILDIQNIPKINKIHQISKIYIPKLDTIMSHIIWLECLKILKYRNCAILMFKWEG